MRFEYVMSQLYIPQYRLVDDTAVKTHYVYVVEILHCGKRHTIEKRYSAFHSLHRELRKQYTTPLFPPKRVRNSHPKVLEQRRLGLERYLQEMLKCGPTRKRVLSFFGLHQQHGSTDSLLELEEQTEDNQPLGHQPIFTYEKDPYLLVSDNTKFPDILSSGVLSALYGVTSQLH